MKKSTINIELYLLYLVVKDEQQTYNHGHLDFIIYSNLITDSNLKILYSNIKNLKIYMIYK